MRSSHNNFQLIDALVNCAQHLEPGLAIEFINLSLETHQAHLEVLEKTLSESEMIKQRRLISQGSIILSLIRHGSREV